MGSTSIDRSFHGSQSHFTRLYKEEGMKAYRIPLIMAGFISVALITLAALILTQGGSSTV